VTHRASGRFWDAYSRLAPHVQAQANKQFELLKRDPRHPSLQFKKVGKIWSARVNISIRALAAEDGEDFVWFWIGDHREYERLIHAIKKA
jgi:hypothetical protein